MLKVIFHTLASPAIWLLIILCLVIVLLPYILVEYIIHNIAPTFVVTQIETCKHDYGGSANGREKQCQQTAVGAVNNGMMADEFLNKVLPNN